METVWYAVVAAMLSAYVVLDGFDFGVGILQLFLSNEDIDRQQALAAIGPFWNGNEVWLIASGGMLVFCFPRVYATGFSGFYLPLMMVLWLLILRGLSLEFRAKENNPLWHTFWDTTFCLSSLLMAIVLGAALGNVIRGVPIGKDGYFDGALFTNFMPGPNPGVLDWYTVSVGIFAAFVLAGHGALYLVWRTQGTLAARAAKAVGVLWPIIIALMLVVTVLTNIVRPELFPSLLSRPWTWLLAVVAVGGLFGVFYCGLKGKELLAFVCSGLFILGLLAATAAGMYPNMLISTVDPAFSITAHNGAAGHTGLAIGLYWWVPTIILAILYLANLFRTFRGKIDPAVDVYGH